MLAQGNVWNFQILPSQTLSKDVVSEIQCTCSGQQASNRRRLHVTRGRLRRLCIALTNGPTSLWVYECHFLFGGAVAPDIVPHAFRSGFICSENFCCQAVSRRVGWSGNRLYIGCFFPLIFLYEGSTALLMLSMNVVTPLTHDSAEGLRKHVLLGACAGWHSRRLIRRPTWAMLE